MLVSLDDFEVSFLFAEWAVCPFSESRDLTPEFSQCSLTEIDFGHRQRNVPNQGGVTFANIYIHWALLSLSSSGKRVRGEIGGSWTSITFVGQHAPHRPTGRHAMFDHFYMLYNPFIFINYENKNVRQPDVMLQPPRRHGSRCAFDETLVSSATASAMSPRLSQRPIRTRMTCLAGLLTGLISLAGKSVISAK